MAQNAGREFDLKSEAFVTGIYQIMGFPAELASYNEKHGILDLQGKDSTGNYSKALKLINRFLPTNYFDASAFLRAISDTEKVKINWFEVGQDNITPLQALYNRFAIVGANEFISPFAELLSHIEVPDAGAAAALNFSSQPCYQQMLDNWKAGKLDVGYYKKVLKIQQFLDKASITNFPEAILYYIEEYKEVLDLKGKDLSGHSIMSNLLARVPNYNVDVTKAFVRAITDREKVRVDWLELGTQGITILEEFFHKFVPMMGYEIAVVLAEILSHVELPGDSNLNIHFSYDRPYQEILVQWHKGKGIDVEYYRGVAKVQKFLKDVNTRNMREELDTYNEKYGVLDLRVEGWCWQGASKMVDLLRKFFPLDGEDVKAFVRAINNPQKVTVDWLELWREDMTILDLFYSMYVKIIPGEMEGVLAEILLHVAVPADSDVKIQFNNPVLDHWRSGDLVEHYHLQGLESNLAGVVQPTDTNVPE